MSGTSTVLRDSSILSRMDQQLFRLERFLALVSGLAVFSLMVVAVISVSGRNMFNAPLPGYVDWIEQIMPLVAFMGVSYVQREGGHIRMDILIGQLKGRAMWLAEMISVLMILLLIVALIYGSWSHFLRSLNFDAPWWSGDSSIDIGIPIWPTKLLVPVAFSVLAARLVLQALSYGRAFLLNSTAPTAVPIIQTAAEQAAAEAEQLDGQG
ncbi:MAG: TRAP transporter small permease [Rhodobacteraceae bacterium]|nr:TRAP transporter small permease [Paracoccaceae bacterium]